MNELRPEVRLWIAERALAGQAISAWWQLDWSEAKKRAVGMHSSGSGMTMDGHFESTNRGIEVWFSRRYEGAPADVNDRNFESRVRPPDHLMSWSEIREIVLEGATPERREAYLQAQKAYSENAAVLPPNPWVAAAVRKAQGQPDGNSWYFEDPANQAHWSESSRITGALQEAARDIIEAGCELIAEREAEQEIQLGLW